MLIKQTLAIGFALTMFTHVAAAAEPLSDPAIIAIDAAIQSIQQQPNQFDVQLTCTGVQASASGGGTGLSVNVTGGGLGSQTTGMNVTMDSAACQAAASNSVNALNQNTLKQLADLKTSLEAPTPDKSTILSQISDLGKSYIAPALVAAIKALVESKFHA